MSEKCRKISENHITQNPVHGPTRPSHNSSFGPHSWETPTSERQANCGLPTVFPRFLAASKCSRKMSDIFRHFPDIFPSFFRHFPDIFLIFFTPVLEKALLGRLRTGPRYPRGRGASDVERRTKSGRPLESYYLWQPHNLSDSFPHVSDIFPSFFRHFSVIFPTFFRHFPDISDF